MSRNCHFYGAKLHPKESSDLFPFLHRRWSLFTRGNSTKEYIYMKHAFSCYSNTLVFHIDIYYRPQIKAALPDPDEHQLSTPASVDFIAPLLPHFVGLDHSHT